MAERAFWPTSQEQDFSQIEDLCRNTANNITITYNIIEQVQGKLITKVFFTFKKPYFWPIFGQFPQFWRAKKIFPKNPALSQTT